METTTDEQTTQSPLALAKEAIRHTINAICDDPRKFWLLGNGTGSWEKLTSAHAALIEMPVERVRETFRPRNYEEYCEEKEAQDELLEACREHGITAENLRGLRYSSELLERLRNLHD